MSSTDYYEALVQKLKKENERLHIELDELNRKFEDYRLRSDEDSLKLRRDYYDLANKLGRMQKTI